MNATVSADNRMPGAAEERRKPGRLRRWWRNTPLRRKLLTVASLAMVACLPPMVVAFTLMWRVSDARAQVRDTARLGEDVATLQDRVAQADIDISYYAILSFDDPRYVQRFREAAREIPGLVDEVEAELGGDDAEAMRRLRRAVEHELDVMNALADYRNPASMDAETATDAELATERPPNLLDLFLQFNAAVDETHEATGRLETTLADRLESQRDDVNRLLSLLAWSVVLGWIAALAIILAGTWLVSSSIVRRIETLSDNGQRFLLGRPMLPTVPSKDEIGRLSDGILIAGELLDQRRREAVAANRSKDEFISRISHELRTPLTAVIGFGQLLEEDEELPEDDRDSARHIVSGGQHLLAMINDLLDVSKFDTGHLAVTIGPVDACEIARETAALVQSLAQSRAIDLDVRCPDTPPLVAADPQRLRQVLLNLLSNAIKYNRESGHVGLELARRADDTVRFSVTDTGEGIPPGGVERLFQPFERLGAESTAVEGSGIGLALSKRLVEAMHGTIGVESQVGVGTTFWVDIPVAVPEQDDLASLTTHDPA